MPKLKDINAPQKVEYSFYLTPSTKKILVDSALDLKTKQSDILENLIINFDNQKRLFSSIDYIEKREKLFTEMVEKIQMGIDLNTKFNKALTLNLSRYDELMTVIEDHKNSIDTFKVELVNLIEGKFNSL